jgi:hypothetical protein
VKITFCKHLTVPKDNVIISERRNYFLTNPVEFLDVILRFANGFDRSTCNPFTLGIHIMDTNPDPPFSAVSTQYQMNQKRVSYIDVPGRAWPGSGGLA